MSFFINLPSCISQIKKKIIITSAFGALQLILSLYKNYKKYFLAYPLHWNGRRMHQKAIFLRNSIISTFHFLKPKIEINQLIAHVHVYSFTCLIIRLGTIYSCNSISFSILYYLASFQICGDGIILWHNHVLVLFCAKFTCILAIRYLAFRCELCKGSV